MRKFMKKLDFELLFDFIAVLIESAIIIIKSFVIAFIIALIASHI